MFETSNFHLFTLSKVPVQLSLGFFILAAFILVMQKLTIGIPLVLAITLSVLIHEFGHAMVCKRYDLRPSIVLHGFGGYCLHDIADTDRRDALIVVMGPVVEIIFGVLALVALYFMPAQLAHPGLDRFITTFLTYFAWVSIVWGAANLLLPIYPLDGGKLFLLILRRFVEPRKAERWALIVSIGVMIPIGIFAVSRGMLFLVVVIFFMAMENYSSLTSGRPLITRGVKGGIASPASKATPFVQELYKEAEAAFKAEDWREAARLCHQARAQGAQIPKKMMDRMWEIMGLATEAQGEHEEALGYLKRAPQTAAVKAATARCHEALGS